MPERYLGYFRDLQGLRPGPRPAGTHTEPMASSSTVVGNHEPASCWCCGQLLPVDRMVHLGNHPEVTVCIRCAHSLSKWAWELEDRGRTSPGARARDAVRALRKTVVRHGWHHHPLIGRYLRWLGKHTP